MFRLATQLGKFVSEVEQMSGVELLEWMAYYKIEPWGEKRADMRAGVIASTIANIFRKKGRKPFKPVDFMLQFEKPKKRKQTADEIKNAFMKLVDLTKKNKGKS